MGRQIIKQPNGLFALWSSNSDKFVWIDATKQEMIDAFAEEARKEAVERTEEIFAELEAGGSPYYQWTQTYEEAVAYYERVHGKKFNPEEVGTDDE